MIEHYLRPQYQRLCVNPIAGVLTQHVSPNQITLLSGLLGLLVLPAVLTHQIFLAVVLLLLSGYCDTLDGSLARLTNHSSNWGSVLDIMTDRMVEITLVIALWAVDPSQRGMEAMLMMASMLLCITSFLVVGIFQENDSEKSFHYSPGLMERAEAFAFFIAMLLCPSQFQPLAWCFVVLVTWTAIYRIYEYSILVTADKQ